MITLDNICINKNIKGGRPVIKSTQVPVDLILGKLAGGMTYDEAIDEYEITRQDLFSAQEYASAYIS